jgi:RimJ/RimL family protein N-acetyltransferase
LAIPLLELGLNRVHAFVMTSNQRSIRLLDRCGFSREGTLRHYRIARGDPFFRPEWDFAFRSI